MVNVEIPLQNWNIDTRSRLTAVASTREVFENAAEEKRVDLVNEFFRDVFGIRANLTDAVIGRMAAQYAVDEISQSHYEFGNAPKVVERAVERAIKFRNDPSCAWMFVTSETQSSFKTDSDAPTAPKKNKGTASWDLYVIHVKNAETPLTNIQFVDFLVKELKMTKSGARTYAYNCFKRGKEEA